MKWRVRVGGVCVCLCARVCVRACRSAEFKAAKHRFWPEHAAQSSAGTALQSPAACNQKLAPEQGTQLHSQTLHTCLSRRTEYIRLRSEQLLYGCCIGMSLPAKHVAESWQSAEFYVNKVLVQHRASGPEHVAWVQQLKAAITALGSFVQVPRLLYISLFDPEAVSGSCRES